MSAIQRCDRNNAWWVDFQYRGRRIRKRSPVQTRRETERFERVLRNEFLSREEQGYSPFLGPAPLFSSFAEHWMYKYARTVNRLATQVGKQSVLRHHLLPAFGDLRLDQVTTERIDELKTTMRSKGLSAKTINNALSVLRTCLTTAVKWGVLGRCPAMTMLPLQAPGYDYLSISDAQRLIAGTASAYWRTLILFLLHTGCRFGEAAALRWADLEFSEDAARARIQHSAYRGVVGPTKNGRTRDIPLTDELIESLQAFSHNGPFVFALLDGSIPDPANTLYHLHRICDQAGIRRISWHVFRHTFATELSTRQVPLRAIQDLLGHSTIVMTSRYAHVADHTLQAAVAALPSLQRAA